MEAKQAALARGLSAQLAEVAAVWLVEKRHQGSGVSGGWRFIGIDITIAKVRLATLLKHLDFAKHYLRLLNS